MRSAVTQVFETAMQPGICTHRIWARLSRIGWRHGKW
jgi:hypothetical protein